MAIALTFEVESTALTFEVESTPGIYREGPHWPFETLLERAERVCREADELLLRLKTQSYWQLPSGSRERQTDARSAEVTDAETHPD